jgi:AraC-like DNA-binding protein
MKNYNLEEQENNARLGSFHDLIRLSQKRAQVADYEPEEYLIVNLLQEGSAEYITNTEKLVIKPDDIIITQPEEKHQIQLSAPNKLNTLIYSPSYINEFIRTLSSSHKALLDNPYNSSESRIQLSIHSRMLIKKWESVELIKKLYYIAQTSEEPTGKLLQDALFHDALLSIIRNDFLAKFEPNQSSEKQSKGIQQELYDRINLAKAYIADNYHQDISLDILAQLCNMSKFHFARVFKEQTHMSPYNYLIATRVEEAKHLLIQTSLPVTEIALRVGFNTHITLYNAFQKVLGISPSEYRS